MAVCVQPLLAVLQSPYFGDSLFGGIIPNNLFLLLVGKASTIGLRFLGSNGEQLGGEQY